MQIGWTYNLLGPVPGTQLEFNCGCYCFHRKVFRFLYMDLSLTPCKIRTLGSLALTSAPNHPTHTRGTPLPSSDSLSAHVQSPLPALHRLSAQALPQILPVFPHSGLHYSGFLNCYMTDNGFTFPPFTNHETLSKLLPLPTRLCICKREVMSKSQDY
jgi:hypothetical protein